MGQFGMQMPGGRQSRGAGPDVYTAMMFIGAVAMLAAVVLLYIAASKVAPGGQPWQVQDPDRIELPR